MPGDMRTVDVSFYRGGDVVGIAQALIGKLLVTDLGGVRTTGRIVETEAYAGETDRASHAYGGRRTARTEVMYAEGGVAYVYLCYGMHPLFNVVTHEAGVPHAVLVRALEPLAGVEAMHRRTGGGLSDRKLCSGPGRLARAMGITVAHTGKSLLGRGGIRICEDGAAVPGPVIATPRIGVDYAGPDAHLPYRFVLSGCPFVSGPRHLRP